MRFRPSRMRRIDVQGPTTLQQPTPEMIVTLDASPPPSDPSFSPPCLSKTSPSEMLPKLPFTLPAQSRPPAYSNRLRPQARQNPSRLFSRAVKQSLWSWLRTTHPPCVCRAACQRTCRCGLPVRSHVEHRGGKREGQPFARTVASHR